MKKIVLSFFFVFLFALSSDSFCQEKGSNIQIVTSDMIKSAGIISLSDILLLSDKWNYATIDGFTKTVSANNLSPYQRQNFILMIDGQKYDIGIFDIRNINLLPVSISQIDYVELFNTPQIVEGNYAESGLIHFHTKKPVKGISGYVNEIVGNETGDPGPYRYTELTTPNIDKIGPFFSVGLNYGSKNWFAKAAYKNEETFDTDALIIKRIYFLNGDNYKATMNSGWGELDVNWFAGNTRFSGGMSSHDDFFFFKPSGFEIPAFRGITQAGTNGIINLDKNISLKYIADYSENELGKRENNINFNFDLIIKKLSANFEGIYKQKYLTWNVGLGIDKTEALSSMNIERNTFINKKFYSSISFFPSAEYVQTIQVYYLKNKNWNSLKGSLFNYWTIDKNNMLSSSFSFFEHVPDEDMSYWNWYNKGYDLQKDLNIEYDVYGVSKKSKTITADISYNYKYDTTFSAELFGSFRYFLNYYIEKQPYQYLSNGSIFAAPVSLYQDEALRVAGGGITLSHRISNKFTQKLIYNYQQDITGSDVFKEAWHSIPNHNLTYIIQYNPVATFGIWAKIKYLSSSVWYDYKYSDYQADGRNDHIIKSRIVFDLSFQKWFFHRTIWVNLLLRNMFNQDEKYNPIGVNMALTDFIQVHFYFDSIPE